MTFLLFLYFHGSKKKGKEEDDTNRTVWARVTFWLV